MAKPQDILWNIERIKIHMTNQLGTRMIFSIKYAGKLIKMGHEVLETLPNPKRPDLDMFLFKVDATFDEDFKKVQRKEQE